MNNKTKTLLTGNNHFPWLFAISLKGATKALVPAMLSKLANWFCLLALIRFAFLLSCV